MDVVHPMDFLGIRFHVRQVEIDDDRFLTAATKHARERLDIARVDLLMRNVWRNEDEVAWACLRSEFEAIAPFHPRATADHVDHALDRTVMMRTGLRFRVNDDRPGPEFLGARARMRDRSSAVHARRLSSVGIQLIGMNDSYAMQAPMGFGDDLLLRRISAERKFYAREAPWRIP